MRRLLRILGVLFVVAYASLWCFSQWRMIDLNHVGRERALRLSVVPSATWLTCSHAWLAWQPSGFKWSIGEPPTDPSWQPPVHTLGFQFTFRDTSDRIPQSTLAIPHWFPILLVAAPLAYGFISRRRKRQNAFEVLPPNKT